MENKITELNTIIINSISELIRASFYVETENANDKLNQFKYVYDILYDYIYEYFSEIELRSFPITYPQYYNTIFVLKEKLIYDKGYFIQDVRGYVLLCLDILSHVLLYSDFTDYTKYFSIFKNYEHLKFQERERQFEYVFNADVEKSLNTIQYISENLESFCQLIREV